MDCPLFCLFAFADIAEDKHDAHGRAAVVSYGRAAVVDGNFRAVLHDQDRVVGQTDDHPLPEHLDDRAFNRGSGLLVNDVEYLRHRFH